MVDRTYVRTRAADVGLQATARLVRMPAVPPLPAGEIIDLPGRGSTYVADTGVPASAEANAPVPTLILLHALACTGLLTWYPCVEALRRRYRLITFDQRWHGQGIRATDSTLADCADDVAAVADTLGIDRFMVAGYSMGSLIAQLTWLRHGDRLDGLVLCAGATNFTGTPRSQAAFARLGHRLSLRGSTGATPPPEHPMPGQRVPDSDVDDRWAWRQFRSTTGRDVLAATSVLARFDSRAWIHQVDVPTSVVVTARDRVVSPARQRAMAAAIPGATVFEADAGHVACVLQVERFRPAMLAATASVWSRSMGLRRT